MSCDLRALAKMVQSEFGNEDLGSVGFASTIDVSSSPLFERGRFYDEYSARRNERLKRKKIETGDEKETVYDLGVKVETAKRRDSKKFESARKSASAIYSLERSENPRYMLRSSQGRSHISPREGGCQPSTFLNFLRDPMPWSLSE